MIFTRSRDTDQDRLFPHRADGFELTISANGDQAKEEAIEDEDKEEEEAATILRNTYNEKWLLLLLLVGCFK